MLLFHSTASLIILGAAILLHIGTQLIYGIFTKILTFVNIALHIALIIPLLLDGVPIEEAVLAYMISVFTYTLSSFVSHTVSVRRAGKEQRDDV